MSTSVTPDYIMQLGLGFWASKTLLSAVELDLFTEMAKGPAPAEAGVERLGVDPRVALRMLERDGEGRYYNAPEAATFLDRSKPSYMGGMLEMANARLYPFWGSLTEALRTGGPQNEGKRGDDFFGALYADPARLEGFLSAMSGLSLGAARAIARKFPWGNYETSIDVGGAQGGLPVQVALAHTNLRGGHFDLPEVRPVFEKYVAAHKLSDRLKFFPGNFFKDPMPAADVLVMGHILHDWNLEEKRELLKKAYDALPAGGALVVYEALIDDRRRDDATGLLMSLNMLIETPGGFDYTGEDCQRWMREAGFRETRVEYLAGPDSMVVGIK